MMFMGKRILRFGSVARAKDLVREPRLVVSTMRVFKQRAPFVEDVRLDRMRPSFAAALVDG